MMQPKEIGDTQGRHLTQTWEVRLGMGAVSKDLHKGATDFQVESGRTGRS